VNLRKLWTPFILVGSFHSSTAFTFSGSIEIPVGAIIHPRYSVLYVWNSYFDAFRVSLSYPTFKTHSKNGDSYQVMTQATRQEPLLTTLYLLPAGSRIIGG
jgi:hypothetical protein